MKYINYFSSLILILVLSSCGGGAKQSGKTTEKTKKIVNLPKYNSDSAFYYVKKQVEFGPRVPGSKSHNECANWLSSKMSLWADTVIVQNFKTRTWDKVTRRGKNIIASFNVSNPNRILLMAHWDSRPYADHDDKDENHHKPIDGANDGASGVGILMEMARNFAAQNPDVGVDIVLFDIEDFGPPSWKEMYESEYWCLGSQYWSNNPHILGYTARYGILLDMAGTKNPKFPREAFSDRNAGFVMDLVWDAAAEIGYGNYFLNQQGPAITDDHYFVSKIANIPSIDIIHLDTDSKNGSFFPHWHTSQDNLENIDKSTLKMIGDVLTRVVYYE